MRPLDYHWKPHTFRFKPPIFNGDLGVSKENWGFKTKSLGCTMKILGYPVKIWGLLWDGHVVYDSTSIMMISSNTNSDWVHIYQYLIQLRALLNNSSPASPWSPLLGPTWTAGTLYRIYLSSRSPCWTNIIHGVVYKWNGSLIDDFNIVVVNVFRFSVVMYTAT